jgi:quercetin dioxygenase-like cupin family protein
MFVRLREKPFVEDGAYRYHTATIHNFVVSGSVSTISNGKRITIHAGEYFRAPAGWLHSLSHGGEATIFMVVEQGAGGDPLESIDVAERVPAVA